MYFFQRDRVLVPIVRFIGPCFVPRLRLIGISQREVTAFYPALLEKKDDLRALIHDFFVDKIRPRFEPENFTFYVYVTGERVKLVDSNPWAEFALPLLFTWEKLEQCFEEEKEVEVEFQIVEGQCKVQPGLKTAVPYDYLDTSPGSGWDQFFRNAGEELRHQNMSSDAGA